jgi:flavin-dependent dehydrogenase
MTEDSPTSAGKRSGIREGSWDVLIAGGGPAGAGAGLYAARKGLKVLIIDKDEHPRFHIGESMLPQTAWAWRKLGLEGRIQELPHMPKYGGSFALGHERETEDFEFENNMIPGDPRTLNIERAPFDRVLLEAAEEAGATVLRRHRIRKIAHLAAGQVRLIISPPEGEDFTVEGHHLLDASGQGTLVGHHLQTRRTLPSFKRVAFYNHYTGVPHREGTKAGNPLIVMCEEGWFWLIPISREKTSVGFVTNGSDAKRLPVEKDRALEYLLARCPMVHDLTRDASAPEINMVAADFSYTCRPYAGPGYFLLGDAATFIDPMFSTGVCMGLMSSLEAVDLLIAGRTGKRSLTSAYRRYDRYIAGSSGVFFDLVHLFYDHAFREVFLHGMGPVNVQGALTTVLAGTIYPRLPWSVRWRLELLKTVVRMNRFVPMVPRRPRFSLLDPA